MGSCPVFSTDGTPSPVMTVVGGRDRIPALRSYCKKGQSMCEQASSSKSLNGTLGAQPVSQIVGQVLCTLKEHGFRALGITLCPTIYECGTLD